MPTESHIKNAVQYAEYNAYLMNQSKQKSLDRNSRCPAFIKSYKQRQFTPIYICTKLLRIITVNLIFKQLIFHLHSVVWIQTCSAKGS